MDDQSSEIRYLSNNKIRLIFFCHIYRLIFSPPSPHFPLLSITIVITFLEIKEVALHMSRQEVSDPEIEGINERSMNDLRNTYFKKVYVFLYQ